MLAEANMKCCMGIDVTMDADMVDGAESFGTDAHIFSILIFSIITRREHFKKYLLTNRSTDGGRVFLRKLKSLIKL